VSDAQEIMPVPVHLVADDTKQQHLPPHMDVRTYTIVITAANPVPEVLPQDRTREYAVLQALDNQVVLCSTKADAQQPGNSVVGLPNPAGAVLATGIAIPVKGTSHMRLAAAVYPSRVSVIAGYRTGG
jgi:hypothetical protein